MLIKKYTSRDYEIAWEINDDDDHVIKIGMPLNQRHEIVIFFTSEKDANLYFRKEVKRQINKGIHEEPLIYHAENVMKENEDLIDKIQKFRIYHSELTGIEIFGRVVKRLLWTNDVIKLVAKCYKDEE